MLQFVSVIVVFGFRGLFIRFLLPFWGLFVLKLDFWSVQEAPAETFPVLYLAGPPSASAVGFVGGAAARGFEGTKTTASAPTSTIHQPSVV